MVLVNKDGWSREQLLVAFHLYCRLPFGKMHRRNPDIVQYAVRIGRTASALAMKLTNIASLDPAITSTGRKGLEGASLKDRAMWDEMQRNWEEFALEAQRAVDAFAGDAEPEPSTSRPSDTEDYEAGERVVSTRARIGQAFFRSAVLSAYEYRCCISGLAVPQLLVASHIVPWKADAKNRLNPQNGLCLSVLHDKAFDLGLICLTDDMMVRVSPRLKHLDDAFLKSSIGFYEGLPVRAPEKFCPNRLFLAYHRENIYSQ